MRRESVPFVFFLLLFCPLHVIGANADRPALVGEVAYSEPLIFDYNRDGRPKKVQLWASFDIKPAVGKEGESGYLAEEGSMRRYMKDIELGAPVIGYDEFNMLPNSPLGKAVPVSDIVISGHTAAFTSRGLRFTVTDNGPGVTKDSIIVNDGIRDYPVSLFDGDLKIITGGQ